MNPGRPECYSPHPPEALCPSRRPKAQIPIPVPQGAAQGSMLDFPMWAGKGPGHYAYLVLLHSTVGTFTVGRVCEATGSMVSVLSSTAVRTRAESCGRSGESSEMLGDGELTGWVPS